MGKARGEENEQDKAKELELWNPWEEEEEPEIWIDYVCVECGLIDPVPEFIVAECSYELEAGESPEFFCPVCNGTLVRKEEPADK
jgi:DNA-directed RNA polymerase subunit RPC12/RpoP